MTKRVPEYDTYMVDHVETLYEHVKHEKVFVEFNELQHFSSYAKQTAKEVEKFAFSDQSTHEISYTGKTAKFEFSAGTGKLSKDECKELNVVNDLIVDCEAHRIIKMFPDHYRWRLVRCDKDAQPLTDDHSDINDEDKLMRIIIPIRTFSPQLYIDGTKSRPLFQTHVYEVDCTGNKKIELYEENDEYDNNLYLVSERIAQ
jgi:hypothetical protein